MADAVEADAGSKIENGPLEAALTELAAPARQSAGQNLADKTEVITFTSAKGKNDARDLVVVFR